MPERGRSQILAAGALVPGVARPGAAADAASGQEEQVVEGHWLTERDRGRSRSWPRRLVPVAVGAVLVLGALPWAGAALPAFGPRSAPPAHGSPPATPAGFSVADVSPPDFLQVGKAVFFARSSTIGRPLEERDLGEEIGRVGSVDTSAATLSVCNFLERARDDLIRASFLAEGVPVYAVAGYEPWFRVAAWRRGELVPFEVGCRAEAQVGADLLDIDGRVTHLTVHAGNVPGLPEVASITEADLVARLVDLVLKAPIDPSFGAQPPPVDRDREYVVAFHLADGTATLRFFRAATGELWQWIATPPEFGRAIEAAVSRAGTPVAHGRPGIAALGSSPGR